jgi:Na+-translocating ferredoxin:NAD+ oxidoreductase subunit C
MLRLQRFRRGIHPPENKNTMDYPTVRLDSFRMVQIPMSMHIGVPCEVLVKPGDEVKVGQLIGDSQAFMSAPIHSSVSGTVLAVRKVVASSGVSVEVVEIESDGQFTPHESVVPPVVNDRQSFVDAIHRSGLVGLGGAGFPTHVKLCPPAGKEPDLLVINAAECEPYITSDYRQCLEHPDEIIGGILDVMKWLEIPKAVIGIEDNKKPAVRILRFHIDRLGCKDRITVKILKTMYPQGAEKTLIHHAVGRIFPSGGLPHDVGVLILNVSTTRFIERYLKTGMPLVRKRITLDGGALVLQCNVNVPMGAMVADIIESVGGVKEEPAKVVMGGSMMGVAMDRLDFGVIKGNNAILVLDSKEAAIPVETQCIRCSRCIDACPMLLLPTTIDLLARNKDIEELKRHHTMDCFECGCCAYVCPAKRYLVQSIRYGKFLIRTEPSLSDPARGTL